MADTATVAVLFCDLVSSTERQSRLGDDAADDFRRRFFAALRAPVTAHGGTEIKSLGDGLMATFESTTGALLCAIAMHHDVADLDPADPVLLRIGISVGEVGHEDDDWFGTPVVEAARLCAVADPGGTFATAVVRTVVGSRGSHLHFTHLGPMPLKGLPAPVEVVSVVWLDDLDAPVAEVPTPTPPPRPVTVAATASPRSAGRVRVLAALVLGMLIIAGSAWVFDVAVDHTGTDDDQQADTRDERPAGVTRPSGYQPSFRTVSCRREVSAAVPDAECGQLNVPEVRDHPASRKIHVDVTRAPALGAATSPPVLLIDVNEQLATSPLREHSDVYSVTLRGLSPADQPRLDCPELRDTWRETLARAPDDVTAISERRSAAGACAARLRASDAQLEGYTMAEVADDLRDLVLTRRLGRVSVAASGFSTPAAAAFARENPGAIDSLLLANPTPPGESPIADPTLYLKRSLDALVALCHDDDACRGRFPDLPGEFVKRVGEYAAAPLSVLTTPLSPEDPGVQVLLDGRRMAAALAAALQSSDQLPLVPSAISPRGVSPQLLAAASINEDLLFYAGEDATAGAVLSYFCSYDVRLNRTAEVADTALSPYAGANDPSLQALCEEWDVPMAFDRLSQPLSGDLPVMFLEGGLSVAGVNGWADQMAANLPNSTVVHVGTLSEDVSYRQPPCVRAIRSAFLARPEAKQSVAACEGSTPPIEFLGV